MISNEAILDALTDAAIVVDAGLEAVGDHAVAVELVYRDAYLTLTSRLYDSIRRESF